MHLRIVNTGFPHLRREAVGDHFLELISVKVGDPADGVALMHQRPEQFDALDVPFRVATTAVAFARGLDSAVATLPGTQRVLINASEANDSGKIHG